MKNRSKSTASNPPSMKITFISLGPGDPGLVPLKSCKVLLESDAILIPTKSSDGELEKSRTYQILERLESETTGIFVKPFRMSGEGSPEIIPVYTPMRYRREDWENQLDVLLDASTRFNRVSYVTMGDAGIYSTVYYLLDLIEELRPDLHPHCKVIPGITSFSQASSLIKKPLCKGDTSLRIDSYTNGVKEGEPSSETTVYLRPRRDTLLNKLNVNGDVYTFRYLNFAGESIAKGVPSTSDEYLTLTIDFR